MKMKMKIFENISVYDILYKTSTGPKPLHIRFDKIDGFFRVSGGEIKHLVLFDYGMFDKLFNEIKYLISEKVVLQIVLIIIFEIKIDSYNSIPIEKNIDFS